MGQKRDHKVEELALILGITHVEKFQMKDDFKQKIKTNLEANEIKKITQSLMTFLLKLKTIMKKKKI